MVNRAEMVAHDWMTKFEQADSALLVLQSQVKKVLQQIRHIQVPPSLDEPFNHGYVTGRADAAELVAALIP